MSWFQRLLARIFGSETAGEDLALRPGEIWLFISRNTNHGAVLCSDHAEHDVPERYFRRFQNSSYHAAMLSPTAELYGLEDGWS